MSDGRAEGLVVGLDVSAVPAEPAGAGRYAVELAGQLARRAHVDLRLVAGRGDAERWHDLAPGARVSASVPRSRWRRLAWEQVAMPRLVRQLKVDVFHSPHYTMPELAKVPRVVTVHDMTFFDNPEWHERVKVPVFRRAIKAAAALADAVICVSRVTADRLVAIHPPKGRLVVIPHGIDHDRFRPDDAAGTDRSVLASLGVDGPYIAFLSTIQPRKDVPTLVRAFDIVAASHPGIALVVAGSPGWRTESTDAAIAGSPYRDRVVRTGWVPDDALPALYRNATAVAYPAKSEGFGFPALEALACGAPLVTTRGTAMDELAGDAAWLFDPGDAGGLAAALTAVLAGGSAVDERRQAGLATAARYTWDACAAAHEDVYRSVLGAN